MLRPDVLQSDDPHGPWSCRGTDVWDTLCAAASGDADGLRALLVRDPNLRRAEYWYTQPIHLAVREGHVEVIELLLDADTETRSATGDDLVTTARDRGHEDIARLLESRGRVEPTGSAADPPIHRAAAAGNEERVRELLDSDPELVHAADPKGGTPLHRAVAACEPAVARLLLERGADVHALHGDGPGSGSGYAAADFQPIDLALWHGPWWNLRGDLAMARLLLANGAAHDLVIASALGELDTVRAMLDADAGRIAETRPSGKHALPAAVEFGHAELARLLLERGASPTAPDGATTARGSALYAAARAGNRELVELLLVHDADPNAAIDSSGTSTFAAATPELRALLVAHGGKLDPHDLVWLGEDEEAVRLVAADPRSADAGCGGVLAAACKLEKRELLERLLQAGARVPSVLTECRSYLLVDPDMLRLLLASGMDPDLPDWMHATPLHTLCGRDGRGRANPRRLECAEVLLDAGASISARDEEYRSTPLAWAARNGLEDMVQLFLERDAATSLPDDEPWTTPLAWATRRGHEHVARLLRDAGAVE